MRKHIALLRITIIQSLQYRTETILWILLDMFPIIVFTAMWTTLFKGREFIGGKTLSELFTYYFAVFVIVNIAEAHFDERWINNILYGRIDHLFLKPIHFLSFIFTEHIGRKIISFVTFLLPMALLITIIIASGLYSPAEISFNQIILFLAFLFLTFICNTFLAFLIVLFAFWFETANSLGHAKWIFTSLFGGTLAPLSFYPEWIQRIAVYLPFSRMIGIPAEIISQQQEIGKYIPDLLVLFSYLIFFFFAMKIIWKKAVIKYCSAGG